MELSKTAPVSLPAYLLRIFLLGIFTVIAIYLAITLGGAISPLFGIGIAIFAVITNIVFLDERLYAWRWIIPAFTGMALLIIYPIGYSVVVAFSNYGSGNILSKEQVVQQFENTFYSRLPKQQLTKPTSSAAMQAISASGSSAKMARLTSGASASRSAKCLRGIPASVSGTDKASRKP
jgi:hypothetical protein